jgi:NAD(P)-dependent dehydrogenase (short-subunit alcohol dehydrogenase family)
MSNIPLFSVEGQVVLVSGASRGIGKAIALGFAENGATVVITGRQEDTLQKTAQELSDLEGAVSAQVCDVAKRTDLERLVQNVMQEFGRIDTLINVAGINIRSAAEEVSEADFDAVLNTNLKGVFLLSQLVGKPMLSQGRGSQINIASLNTDRPLKYCLSYAISKAGVGHLTRTLAMEWGARGVRVNAIAPGFVVTALNSYLWDDKTVLDWGLANIPQKRLGRPEDMVGTAIFLASEASNYVTGQIIYVDGGFTAGWTWPISLDRQP